MLKAESYGFPCQTKQFASHIPRTFRLGKRRRALAHVRQPRRLVKAGSVTFRFLVHDAAGTETASYTATFNAPETLK